MMLCINMIHISPWSATLGLFNMAGKVLRYFTRSWTQEKISCLNFTHFNEKSSKLNGHGVVSPCLNVCIGQARRKTDHLWSLCPRWCSHPRKQPTGGDYEFHHQTQKKKSHIILFQFDLNLRSRDPSWGIRDITELKEVGIGQGLNLDQV